ncbi:uncharacterized protein LOC116849633 [Odontomachus brunneus]|uniref:uncharacterized protein LOC116849633 n=1 Tax=Odontomachus brunneus TaxID=486640 RepID=UPI0013F17F76|nr:uncharacterized protein LOC116849633 [Odontomachus brunneus]
MTLSLLTSKWIQSRYEFLHEVKEQFSRKLQKYEEQMIMFPKSCYLCHWQDNMLTCIKCYSANYCLKHEQDFQEYHSSKCQSLLLFLNLDMKDLCGIKFERKFCAFPDDGKPVDDTHCFIIYYMRNVPENSESWEVNEYVYSDYISGPLTFYYGMKNANLLSLHMDRDLYIVHVITSNYLERKYIAAWELLLHGLRCTKLTIVLVGLELDDESGDIDVCCLCINRQKKLRFIFCSMLYHNYVNDQSFQRPDFIVRFEADFTNKNINKIDMLFQPISRPRYNIENKFKSIRPWRNLENDFVSYRNAHVTIYKNLLPLSLVEPI